MGPQLPGRAHPNRLGDLPEQLASVALIDAKTAAAGGSVSVSWWYEKVATGEAPLPAIRSPRCTRWRLAEVADFWRRFAERSDRGAEVLAQARRASAAAKAKRTVGLGQAEE